MKKKKLEDEQVRLLDRLMEARGRLSEIQGMSRNERLNFYMSEFENDEQERAQASKTAKIPITVLVKPKLVKYRDPWEDEKRTKTLKELMMTKGMDE